MSYTKVTNFAVKDGLPTGNPSKIVKGTEIDAEFNAIQADSLSISLNKADLVNPSFTTPALGIPTSGTLTNCTGLPATAVVNTPAGTVAAVTVQAAINELDTEKAALSGATFTGNVKVPSGTAASPALQVGAVDTGFHTSSSGIGTSIGGLLHGYIGSTGQINYPSTNVWNLGALTSIESHAQNTTNTVTAGIATYGKLLNYISAPANLVSSYSNLFAQATFNGPSGTLTQLRGVYSSVSLGASNLSDVTTVTNYDTLTTVTAGTITTGIGFRAVAGIGTASTNSYGFQGALASGANKWNLFMSGTASNYLAGNLLIGSATDDGVNALQVTGNIKTTQSVLVGSPVTVTISTHTIAATTTYLICNYAGIVTLTLPTASSNTGRSLHIKTITANTVISASSNAVPLVGGAAGTAILAATAGKWAHIVSDGTNWIIMEAN